MWFEDNTNLSFELEKGIAIGNPAKLHNFDIAEKQGKIVIECKMLYLDRKPAMCQVQKWDSLMKLHSIFLFLSDNVDKAIVMLRATHPKRDENFWLNTIFRTNRHLLGKNENYGVRLCNRNNMKTGRPKTND